jgi:4-hydroxy-tetrahydrodipicolinate synthase
MLDRPYRGVIAAPFLPMDEGGEIDWATLARYMDWLAGQAPGGIAMNMDASEVIALSDAEQDEAIRVSRDAIAGRVPFLSGVVAGSTRAAAAKAERFAKAGVDGLAVFPPFPTFSGAPVPGEMIFRFHDAIARASGLPLICFQFPKGWGPDYTPEILARVAEIPQLVAIKEASFDVAQTLSTIAVAARLARPIGVLTGSDTFIFEAMVMGCTGALIGFAGTFTAELVAMNAGVQGGDLAAARAIWAQLGPIARYCWRPPIRDFRPRMKEVLRLQGHFPSAACREPQLGIGGEERAEIARLMRAQGLLG